MAVLCSATAGRIFRSGHKRLVDVYRPISSQVESDVWSFGVLVYMTFTIACRIGSDCPFIERLVLVKTFS